MPPRNVNIENNSILALDKRLLDIIRAGKGASKAEKTRLILDMLHEEDMPKHIRGRG